MVGGGREGSGSTGVNKSTNLFAALRKQKKTSKSKTGSSKTTPGKEQEPPVFWAPAPLTVKSWADVDDDDDDEYYKTTAPPLSGWGSTEPQHAEENAIQESESEDDLLDEGDDDVEDDHEHEEEDPVPAEADVGKPVEKIVVQKEPERQLSKKELKKKEDEEFEALLAGFSVAPMENGHSESNAAKEMTEADQGEGEKKEGSGASESKNAKKKKKKEKAKEAKDTPKVPEVVEAAEDTGPGTEEDTSSIDVKERLKKLASQKNKKKSTKDIDGAAKAAAQEAAARRAKLAAAKKKEKSHYNQQPIR